MNRILCVFESLIERTNTRISYRFNVQVQYDNSVFSFTTLRNNS